MRMKRKSSGGPTEVLVIDISRHWTDGPPAHEIWWSCQISGGPDIASCTFLGVK